MELIDIVFVAVILLLIGVSYLVGLKARRENDDA